jgi:excisionase family DNA binding protein
MADLPAVLTVEEAADFLRIGRSAAYAAVKAGDIPSIRVGRQIRVPRHLLEVLLDCGRGHSVDKAPEALTGRDISDGYRTCSSGLVTA